MGGGEAGGGVGMGMKTISSGKVSNEKKHRGAEGSSRLFLRGQFSISTDQVKYVPGPFQITLNVGKYFL